MEFLKTCQTTAHAVTGFANVIYDVYAPHDPRPSGSLDIAFINNLREIEGLFRAQKYLVAASTAKSSIYVFHSTDRSQEQLKLEIEGILRGVKGANLTHNHHGEIKVTDLCKSIVRTSISSNQPPNLFTISLPPNTRGTQATNARAFQTNSNGAVAPTTSGGRLLDEADFIYELFISAVVGAISYQLSEKSLAVPLNSRTFLVTQPTTSYSEEEERDSNSNRPIWLTTLGAQITSSGTLVISTNSQLRPDLYQLSTYTLKMDRTFPSGTVLRIAPSGTLVKLAVVDSVEAEYIRSSKRVKSKANTGETSEWKRLVIRWLASKGICIPRPTTPNAWVNVIFSFGDKPDTSNWRHRTLCWPASLCFIYAPSKLPRELDTTPDLVPEYCLGHCIRRRQGLDWFQNSFQNGFQDPLRLAEEWFRSKPSKDKLVEARRKMRQLEEQSIKTQNESLLGLPTSPLYSRNDIQAIAGVYPTPPDQLLVSGSHTGLVSDGSIAGHIQIEVPQQNLTMDTQPTQFENNMENHPTSDSVDATKLENDTNGFVDIDTDIAVDDGNNDLFEDMDEEMFGNTGVTDADFNFFDDLGGSSLDDMLSAPDVDAKLPDSGYAEQNDGKIVTDINTNQAIPKHVGEESADTSEMKVDIRDEVKPDPDLNLLKPSVNACEVTQTTGDPSLEIKEEPIRSGTPQSPPLSPLFVKKRLFDSPKRGSSGPNSDGQDQSISRHHDSVFNHVDFSQNMSLCDAKYDTEGRFAFMADSAENSVKEKGTSVHPSINLTDRSDLKIPPVQRGIPRLEIRSGPSGCGGPKDSEGRKVDSSSLESDTDSDDLSVAFAGISPFGQYDEPDSSEAELTADRTKRKWDLSQDDASMDDTHCVDDLDNDTSKSLESLLQQLECDPADWSLTGLPPPKQDVTWSKSADEGQLASPLSSPMSPSLSKPHRASTLPRSLNLNESDFITVVQLVTDQIIYNTLTDASENCTNPLDADNSTLENNHDYDQRAEKIIELATSRVFERAVQCDITSFAAIQESVPENSQFAKNQPRHVQRKGDALNTHYSPIFPIAQPYIRVRRSEAVYEMLPTAVSFWETTGIGPASGPKNLMGFCVYPRSVDLKPHVTTFLENFGSVYDSCKLGTHIRGQTAGNFVEGLAPVDVPTEPSFYDAMQSYHEVCAELGAALASLDLSQTEETSNIDTYVIYIVHPFNTADVLWHLCSAFWTLFEAYRQHSSSKGPTENVPDVILKIIPIDYVASFDSPVVLEWDVLFRLVREIYDRCPPSSAVEDASALSIYSAPSIRLEKSIPRMVPFKLASEPPPDLLHEGSRLHVGYACSFDGSWVTAAWSDDSGQHQHTASYRFPGNRLFIEVAREIWETTVQIIQSRRVTWRVSIASAGVMDKEETSAWVSLINAPSQNPILVFLVAVDPSPNIKLIPAALSNFNQSMNAATLTPATTPQPGISPDQPGNTPAATPSDQTQDLLNDPDARLVDVTDDTWGVILSHRVNNSRSLIEYRPAIASGLLVKRGGDGTPIRNPIDSDTYVSSIRGPTVIGINIVWFGQAGSPRNLGAIGNVAEGGLTTPTGTSGPSSSSIPGSSIGVGITPAASSQDRPQSVGLRNMAENLLRDMIVCYRGLGILGRLRGMRDTKGGAIPWHIAAAIRGVKGLERVCDELESRGEQL
ncbi:hypothetical protein M501DRAFT_166343 [Patellaria atrata CBS 101060]|uniref:Mediator of RNA polymerase II transcription subunit 13 n=1 Tax=Patellaria atrata CBS 101060 TaxID=1346257 RepID=A0A9P4S7N0_9PEZI|nr:hypothetical protein M501DRAFT_166343 [Patellaria atrata CBS 101060]